MEGALEGHWRPPGAQESSPGSAQAWMEDGIQIWAVQIRLQLCTFMEVSLNLYPCIFSLPLADSGSESGFYFCL